MIRSALLGGSCHKAIFPLSLGMGLRLRLGGGGAGGASPDAPLTVTVSGTARMGQTITMDVTGGVPTSQKWQTSADGSTGWADASGETNPTFAVDKDQKLVWLKAIASNASGDYESEPYGPVMPYYTVPVVGVNTQVISLASTLGANVKGYTLANRQNIVATATGVFDLTASYSSSLTSWGYMYDDVGSQDQRVRVLLAATNAATPTAYGVAVFRASGANETANLSMQWASIQTNGISLIEKVNGANIGSSQFVNSHGWSVGTGKAGCWLILERIGSKIFGYIETAPGSGVYTDMHGSGGLTVTSDTLTGTECGWSMGSSVTTNEWKDVGFEPILTTFIGVAGAVDYVDFDPDLQRIRVTASTVGSGFGTFEVQVETSGGTVLSAWSEDADNSLVGTTVTAYSSVGTIKDHATESLVVKLRDKVRPTVAKQTAYTLPVSGGKRTAKVGANIGFWYTELAFQDRARLFGLYAQPASGYKSICGTNVTVSGADSFVDASYVGLRDDGKPSHFPPGTERFFARFATGSYALTGHIPGIYDVTFTQGLSWSLAGYSGWSRTAYDKDAGTATIEISNSILPSSVPEITFNGFGIGGAYVARTLPANPDDLFFHMFKQGADTTKVFDPTWLAAFTAMHGPGAYARSSTFNHVSRTGLIAGLNWNPTDDQLPGPDAAANEAFANGDSWKTIGPDHFHEEASEGFFGGREFSPLMPLRGYVELYDEGGLHSHLNTNDLLTDAAVTKIATFLKAEANPLQKIAPAIGNERWNFAPAYSGSHLLDNRSEALQAGTEPTMNRYRLHARDTKEYIDLWEAAGWDVADGNFEPTIEWQHAGSPIANVRELLGQNVPGLFPKLRHYLVASYGANGDESLYSYIRSSAFMTTASWDKATTDKPAFKTDYLAAMAIALDATARKNMVTHNTVAQVCVELGGNISYANQVRCGQYEINTQHNILSTGGFTEPNYTDVATEVALLMRSAEWGALAVTYYERGRYINEMYQYFDHCSGAVTSNSVKSGIWSSKDKVLNNTDQPYAAIVAYVATL